ncbi:MAG: HEAT repeat domain-containing protein [Planctomycetia bacterium]|nr:HEAT repeat domain-containing protein [Planctomycetia bacterium]
MFFRTSFVAFATRSSLRPLLLGLVLGNAVELRAADTKGIPAEQRAAKVRADLKNPDVEVRRAAIKTLTHSDISRVLLPEIHAALDDSDGEVRSWAATVSGPEGEAALPLVPQLIVQLSDDAAKIARETAARALGRIGRAVPTERRAVPALEKASQKDTDSVTRVVALGALAMMDPDNAARVTAIDVYLTHDDPLTRMKAAHALGQLGDRAKASAPAIAKALEQATETHQRGYLARALGQAGDPAWLPTLYAELAKETSPEASGEMRGAIQRLGGKVPPATKK